MVHNLAYVAGMSRIIESINIASSARTRYISNHEKTD